MKFSLSFAVLSLSLFSKLAYGAACCGGGSSLPALILSDDRWAMASVLSAQFVVAESRSDGKTQWRRDALNERELIWSLSGVYRLGSRWQAGLQIPLMMRSISEVSDAGLGDLSLNVSFELFPPYLYSAWRPRAFLVGGLGLPTGPSSYEVENVRLESRGSGFFTPSLGLVLERGFRDWDFFAFAEAKRPLSRRFSSQRVSPGWSYAGKLGAGYSWRAFRWGLSLGPSYEGKKRFESGARQGSKLVWDSEISMGFQIDDQISLTIAYLDQTLMGPAYNVHLRRSASLGLRVHGI